MLWPLEEIHISVMVGADETFIQAHFLLHEVYCDVNFRMDFWFGERTRRQLILTSIFWIRLHDVNEMCIALGNFVHCL